LLLKTIRRIEIFWKRIDRTNRINRMNRIGKEKNKDYRENRLLLTFGPTAWNSNARPGPIGKSNP
jgi:hypothetical protein